jgi:TRAP-type mannitol/chloroaromatic compound transport system permease large subunit
METAMTLLVLIGAMVLSLLLTFIAGEFLLKGVFKALYAAQKISPPSW